jgi:hypothetical protein
VVCDRKIENEEIILCFEEQDVPSGGQEASPEA